LSSRRLQQLISQCGGRRCVGFIHLFFLWNFHFFRGCTGEGIPLWFGSEIVIQLGQVGGHAFLKCRHGVAAAAAAAAMCQMYLI
jgi:hypothetical protein